ncbi:MAG: type II toxin-antitoxin system VapC family toxin [Leptolyngbyaceae cyanobacterium bins.302]|nr:type II toxin-antitoxin system VapC family toxin [Leptolyngbyaceae cyanobacterium bins.302]
MTYLLDSNTCIRLLNEDQTTNVAQRLAALNPEDISLCSVVKAELYYGALRGSQRDRNLSKLSRFFSQFSSLPFDDASAQVAGQIRASLAAKGTPIGANDI